MGQLERFTGLMAASVTADQFNSLDSDKQDVITLKRALLGSEVTDYSTAGQNGNKNNDNGNENNDNGNENNDNNNGI